MLSGMTTEFVVTLDDQLAEMVRSYATADSKANGNVSDWIASACRSRMLAEDARALALWELQHPNETAAAYAERQTGTSAADSQGSAA